MADWPTLFFLHYLFEAASHRRDLLLTVLEQARRRRVPHLSRPLRKVGFHKS